MPARERESQAREIARRRGRLLLAFPGLGPALPLSRSLHSDRSDMCARRVLAGRLKTGSPRSF